MPRVVYVVSLFRRLVEQHSCLYRWRHFGLCGGAPAPWQVEALRKPSALTSPFQGAPKAGSGSSNHNSTAATTTGLRSRASSMVAASPAAAAPAATAAASTADRELPPSLLDSLVGAVMLTRTETARRQIVTHRSLSASSADKRGSSGGNHVESNGKGDTPPFTTRGSSRGRKTGMGTADNDVSVLLNYYK
jgi:hypothetical protein